MELIKVNQPSAL